MNLADDPKAWNTRLNNLGKLIQELRVTTDSISGTFSPTGLSKELKVTTMEVTDVASKIPATPLTDRNAISVQNKSTNKIFIGNSDVTASGAIGGTGGWEIEAGSYLNFDITDSIEIYGICASGETALIKVLELA